MDVVLVNKKHTLKTLED